jgi:hypothetical protein
MERKYWETTDFQLVEVRVCQRAGSEAGMTILIHKGFLPRNEYTPYRSFQKKSQGRYVTLCSQKEFLDISLGSGSSVHIRHLTHKAIILRKPQKVEIGQAAIQRQKKSATFLIHSSLCLP